MPKTKQWKGFTNNNVDFETSQVPKLKATNLTNRAGHTSNLDQDGLSMGFPSIDQQAGKGMPSRDLLPSKHSKKWIMIR